MTVPDDSLDVCRRYAAKDDRCTVITQANAGVARARNVGMNIAKGRYIMFCLLIAMIM